MDQEVIAVSKLECARRQMEVAIRLYFFYNDPVSIHTLVDASNNILNDFCVKTGIFESQRERFLNCIKPEKKDEMRRALNKPANFFKHSNRDHDEIFEFNTMMTEIELLDCCVMYEGLTKDRNIFIEMFKNWFFIIHPELLINNMCSDNLYNENQRTIYFNDVISVVGKHGVSNDRRYS